MCLRWRRLPSIRSRQRRRPPPSSTATTPMLRHHRTQTSSLRQNDTTASERVPTPTHDCLDHWCCVLESCSVLTVWWCFTGAGRTHQTPEGCEATGCYWSADSRKCYVRYVPGSEGTYAQNFQDWWVRQLAEANGWGKDGTFLDLGAHSGLWCSNTKLLEEKLGWRGVCVEPFPV